jgi:MinD-like ATPase involved in chromosome partitioning or flagellar assembly
LLGGLRKLPADFVLVDLGAGTHPSVMDYFLVGDDGILVLTPEPTSVENAYSFLRAAFYRRLRLAMTSESARRLVNQAMDQGNERGIRTPLDLLREVRAIAPEEGLRFTAAIQGFRPRIVVNSVRSAEDVRLGFAVRSVCRKYFGIAADYVGYVNHDDAVTQAIRQRRPVVVRIRTRTLRNLTRIARNCPDGGPAAPRAPRATRAGFRRATHGERRRRSDHYDAEVEPDAAADDRALLSSASPSRRLAAPTRCSAPRPSGCRDRIDQATRLRSALRRSRAARLGEVPEEEEYSDEPVTLAPLDDGLAQPLAEPRSHEVPTFDRMDDGSDAESDDETVWDGARLRRARLLRRVEVEDVASATKITGVSGVLERIADDLGGRYAPGLPPCAASVRRKPRGAQLPCAGQRRAKPRGRLLGRL